MGLKDFIMMLGTTIPNDNIDWILEDGVWNDAESWNDEQFWID